MTLLKRPRGYLCISGITREKSLNVIKSIDAVVRNLEIIGEAVSAIPLEIRRNYSDEPWTKIVRVRNSVIHRYFGIDTGTLWVIIIE